VFCKCPVCKGKGLRPDKELNFSPVVCWNCKGGCIVDEHTLRPAGFIESEEEKAEKIMEAAK